MSSKKDLPPGAIRRYRATRRYYCREVADYITHKVIVDRVQRNEDVQIVDSDTGEDITRKVLFNILRELEETRTPVLDVEKLKELVRATA